MKNSIFIGYIILLTLIPFGFYLHYQVISYLKGNYPEQWKELGSPTLFLNNSIKNNISIIRFIRNKEYLKINDKDLHIKCRRKFIFDRLYISLVAFIFILFFIRFLKT